MGKTAKCDDKKCAKLTILSKSEKMFAKTVDNEQMFC